MWVETLGDVVWSRNDLEGRARNELARDFPDAGELQQQVAQFAAGVGLMDPTTRDRLDVLAAARGALRDKVDDEEARSALVVARMATENAAYALRNLPHVPVEGVDPDAVRRAALQAIVAAATPEVLALVAARNKYPVEVAP